MNTTKKLCIFCGNPGGSREDAFPRWLSEATDSRGLPAIPFVYDNDNQFQVKGNWRDCGKLITKAVCGECNGGWMCDLEGEMTSLLKPFVVPNSKKPTASELYALGQDSNFQRWVLKTALTLNLQVPKGRTQKLPDNATAWAYLNNLPSTISGYLSWMDEPNLLHFSMSGQPCLHENDIGIALGHEESFTTVFQLNHLTIRLSNMPGAEWLPESAMRNALEGHCEPIRFGFKSSPPASIDGPEHNNIEHFFLAGCHWIPESCDKFLVEEALVRLPEQVRQTYDLLNFGRTSDTIPSLPPLKVMPIKDTLSPEELKSFRLVRVEHRPQYIEASQIFNDFLKPYNLDLISKPEYFHIEGSRASLAWNDEGIELCRSIFDYLAPKAKDGTYFRYVTPEALHDIITYKTLRFFSTKKKASKGEFIPFCQEMGFDGYWRKGKGEEELGLFNELMDNSFYMSFVSKGNKCAKKMWDVFAEKGTGARLQIQITTSPNYENFRHLGYQGSKEFDAYKELLRTFRAKGKELGIRYSSRMPTFSQVAKYSYQQEIRLIAKRMDTDFPFTVKHSESQNCNFIDCKLDDPEAPYFQLTLLDIEPGPNCSKEDRQLIDSYFCRDSSAEK